MTSPVDGVSAIVPARNEAPLLRDLLPALARAEVFEVLICDGGSTDETTAMARDAGAHVLRGAHGPAFWNAAARHARCATLWFLSPCCRPPVQAALAILGLLDETKTRGGWFPVALPGRGLRGWWAARKLNRRARRRGPDLTHGPFLTRDWFEELGGLRDAPDPWTELTARAAAKQPLLEIELPLGLASPPETP